MSKGKQDSTQVSCRMDSLGERFILSVFLLRHLGLRKCLCCSRESWLCVFLLCLDHSCSKSLGHNYLTYGDVEKSLKQRSFGCFRQERTFVLKNRSQEGRRHSLWSEGQRKGKVVIPCRKQICGFCSYFCLCLIFHEDWFCVSKRKPVGDRQGVKARSITPPVLGTCAAEKDTELSIPMPGTYGCCLEVLIFSFN